MEEYRPFPADDSQEPQTDDAVVPALSPTSVLEVHSVEDNNNLNLELMIQGSVDQFVHKDSTDDAVDVVDKASIQKVLDIVQNHEVRTAVMEDKMQCFEKRLLNIVKNFTGLHNNLPHLKGGAETFTSGICRTNTQGMQNPSQAQLTGPKLYSNTDEFLAGEIPMPADKKITETIALKSHDNGKGIAGECLVGMFDITVPNSPDYDDDVIIDEQRSTPRPKSRVANSKPPLARKLHWSTGVPKVGISRTVARSSPVIRSTEMVGELFSGSPCRTRPTKLPKMEPLDNDSIPHSAEISPYIPVLSMRGCVNNQVPLITQVGPPTSVLRDPLLNSYDSPVFLIPQTYDMEFRPTPEMDLVYDEV